MCSITLPCSYATVRMPQTLEGSVEPGSTSYSYETSPGPKGCRNQVLPRPDWVVLGGCVGFTARLVFTSPFLSSTVGMATTGMRVHCSSVSLEDITSVYPSSQAHVLVCGENKYFTTVAKSNSFEGYITCCATIKRLNILMLWKLAN